MGTLANELWLWLANGLGWAAVNSGEVLAACPGGAAEVYESLGSEKLDDILTQKQADKLSATRPEDFALPIAHNEAAGITTLGYDDARYPATLRHIHNPPLALFVKGDTTLLNGQLAIGMVGARRPSAYGVEVAKAIGRGIAMGGAIIISGLAAGLDTEAHKAALAVNGPTIACIAFGHDHCYPASNRGLMEVIEHNGAVVSEYPPATTPEKPYFLQRNRLIAGLGHGLVVVEARKHSGTMSTVNYATDYGRDVFAVPGSIFSELSGGTNAMIREGAYLAASAADVLAVYGIELLGEDPVEAAARQAAEGRPAAASAEAPIWQQNLKRFERTLEAPPANDVLPGQQTLKQAQKQVAQNAAAGPSAAVSTAQAIETFRTLQRARPATDDSELDARNAALDEMVAAVSDSVELSDRAGKSSKVQPYPWGRIERLDKREVENLSPSAAQPTKPGKKRSVASRLLNTNPEVPETPARQTPAAKPQPAPPSTAPVGQVEPVGGLSAVEPISPVERVKSVQATRQVAAAQNAEAAGARPAASPSAPPRRDFVPKAVGDKRDNTIKADTGLADRLKTLPKTAPPAKAPQKAPAAPRAGKKADDPTALLSDGARRAYRELGPKPIDLADLCARSGLSSAEAMAALTELELAGLSRQLAGRQFVLAEL